jgi:hypothetical protein
MYYSLSYWKMLLRRNGGAQNPKPAGPRRERYRCLRQERIIKARDSAMLATQQAKEMLIPVGGTLKRYTLAGTTKPPSIASPTTSRNGD